MSFFAAVNGLQIVSGSLVIPLVGAWTADLELAGTNAISGQVSVVIGNLTLLGTVYRSDLYGGQVRARLVGGYGGWRTQVPAQGYGSPSGISLLTVLTDAAQACGEQISVSSGASIGGGFVRARFPTSVAGDVLWQMVAQGFVPAWYVAPSGVTMTAPWPTSTVSSAFTVTAQRTDEGNVEIATEDYVSWLPGCQFSAPQLNDKFTNAGVIYTWDAGGKFRFDVLTGSVTDRVLGPIQQLVQQALGPLRFFGRYRYSVTNPTVSTIDGSPIDPSIGLPDLQNVPIQASSVASVVPASGGEAHVMFLDGIPTQARCVWVEADATTGPSAITLAPQDTAGVSPVARVNDTAVVFFPPLIQVAGTLNGQPFVGVAAITTPANAIIQTGSPIVSSG